MSNLFFSELINFGIAGGFIVALINYAIDHFIVLRKKLAECKTYVKAGMFISSWVFFAFSITIRSVVKEAGMQYAGMQDDTWLVFIVIGIILTILGTIAANKIWNRDEKVLNWRQCIYVGCFNLLFLIPLWLLNKNDIKKEINTETITEGTESKKGGIFKKILISVVILFALFVGWVYIDTMREDNKFISHIRRRVNAYCDDKSNGVFVICQRTGQTLAFDENGKLIDDLRFVDLINLSVIPIKHDKYSLFGGYLGEIQGEYGFYILDHEAMEIVYTFRADESVYNKILRYLSREPVVLVLKYE